MVDSALGRRRTPAIPREDLADAWGSGDLGSTQGRPITAPLIAAMISPIGGSQTRRMTNQAGINDCFPMRLVTPARHVLLGISGLPSVDCFHDVGRSAHYYLSHRHHSRITLHHEHEHHGKHLLPFRK